MTKFDINPIGKKARMSFFIIMPAFVVAFLMLKEATPGVRCSNIPHVLENTVAHVPDTSFSLAFKESLGFFDDIPQVDWNRYKTWSRQQVDHAFAENPQKFYANNQAKWLANNFFPTFHCPHAKRIGGVGDGPKWVCDPHRLVRLAEERKAAGDPGPHCLIYSVGSNGNYKFEDALINEVGTICEIHVFDFSGNFERPQNKGKNIHFHRWGLGDKKTDRSKEGEFYTFPEILKKLGHEKKTIDIFKIDCEGCELESQEEWINQDIRQVLIETHALPKEWKVGLNYFQSYKQNQYAMFSKEVNGYTMARFYEFSYVRLHPQFWE
jgi:Methyltransferase domain